MKIRYLTLMVTRPGDDELPYSPVGNIRIGSHGIRNGEIVFGADCVTYQEVDEILSDLEADIAVIRKDAKQKLL